MADPGVKGVAGEHDTLGLERGASRGDVIDMERGVGVLLGRERHPESLRQLQRLNDLTPATGERHEEANTATVDR